MLNRFRYAAFTLIFLLSFTGVSFADPQTPLTAKVEDEALALLKQSMEFISAVPGMHFETEMGFDVVQKSGQMIEFGSSRQVSFVRPDKVNIAFHRRDGDRGGIVFNGKELLVFNNDEKVYAKIPLEGDADQAFDYLAEELQMPVPMRDFFSNRPFAILAEKLTSGFYVGESLLAGTPCHHLAFRNARVDFQIWIASGDKPLPRRFVISYRQEEGQPQFWLNFLKWDLTPKFSDNLFSTTPPKGSELIPFAIIDPALKKDGGKP